MKCLLSEETSSASRRAFLTTLSGKHSSKLQKINSSKRIKEADPEQLSSKAPKPQLQIEQKCNFKKPTLPKERPDSKVKTTSALARNACSGRVMPSESELHNSDFKRLLENFKSANGHSKDEGRVRKGKATEYEQHPEGNHNLKGAKGCRLSISRTQKRDFSQQNDFNRSASSQQRTVKDLLVSREGQKGLQIEAFLHSVRQSVRVEGPSALCGKPETGQPDRDEQRHPLKASVDPSTLRRPSRPTSAREDFNLDLFPNLYNKHGHTGPKLKFVIMSHSLLIPKAPSRRGQSQVSLEESRAHDGRPSKQANRTMNAGHSAHKTKHRDDHSSMLRLVESQKERAQKRHRLHEKVNLYETVVRSVDKTDCRNFYQKQPTEVAKESHPVTSR